MSYEEKFRMNARDIEEANYNDACEKVLVKANEHGVQLEVVWSAFKHKEQFPDAPMLQCLQVGADEWDV
jgi:hypothetical protein